MAGVRSVSATLTTSLSVEAARDAFRSVASEAGPKSKLDRFVAGRNARSHESGFLRNTAKFGDMKNELRFFTPDGEPRCSQSEHAPTFSVGASIPHKSGVPVVVHMHVVDRGDAREIELDSLYIEKLGETRASRRKAEEALRGFLSKLQ